LRKPEEGRKPLHKAKFFKEWGKKEKEGSTKEPLCPTKRIGDITKYMKLDEGRKAVFKGD